MASSNTILIVGNTVVCNDYLQQQAVKVLTEVDAKFDMFMLEKQQIVKDLIAAKNRVDNKFKKTYS